MSLLIIGKNGQLGFELCSQSAEEGPASTSCDLPEFDITDRQAVRERINDSGCRLVINAAAYTAVDKAEQEKDPAYAVNSEGPALLALACAERGIPLIHISTDYVFDGSKKGPYRESDPVCPIGVYGKSKAAGEDNIRGALKEHIIIRTAWLYGVHGNNFVKTMLRLGAEREYLNVVSDQVGCPTCAADLAEALLRITRKILAGKNEHWGTYHYAGRGAVSWYGFAEAIFAEAKKYTELKIKKVNPVPTEQYPTAAVRPKNSVLDCSLLAEHFGIHTRPWQDSLKTTIRNLLKEKI